MFKKHFFLLILMITGMLVIAGCSFEDDDSDSTGGSAEGGGDADTEESSEEQVVTLTATDTIPSMDSSMATDSISNQIIGDTTEGLFRLAEDGEYLEGMAIEEEVSSDGLTWTFTLREDAVWSNGDPVTAHDFVYSWTRTVDPVTASIPGQYTMSEVLKNGPEVNVGDLPLEELGVEALDDYTLEVELEKPVPYFKSLLVTTAFLPLNEEFVEEQGDSYATNHDALLSNGPFELTDWDSTSSSWILEKNEDYWDADTVNIDRFEYDVVKDNQVEVDLFEQGEVDRAVLTADLVDQYRSHEDFEVQPEMALFYMRLNQTSSDALANENIRAAIIRAFDKEALVDTILNDGSRVSTGMVAKDFFFHPETGEDFRELNGDLIVHDVEEAQEYWEQGLEELGTDSVEIELLTDDTETYGQMTEYLSHQLETNLEGLTVTIRMVPFEQRLDLDLNMNYDIQITGVGPSYQDPYAFLNPFVTDQGNNMGYSSERFDELIDQAMNELALEEVERLDALLEAERVLFEDAALAPIYQRSKGILVSPDLEGVITNPIGKEYEYKWATFE